MVVTFARKFLHSAQQFAQRILSMRMAVYSARLVGKYLNTNASPDAGGFSDFLVGALEPFRGKQVNRGRGNQAGLAIVAGVAGSGVRRFTPSGRLVSE